MRTHPASAALALLMLSAACAPPADQEMPADEATPAQAGIEGAWRISESWGSDAASGEWRLQNVQPSLFLFMDGYYSITYVRGDEPRPLLPDTATRLTLTFDETRAVWIPYTSNSGTWTLSGDVLTTRPIVALWPNFMAGDSATFRVTREDGTLLLEQTGEELTWNARLERLR